MSGWQKPGENLPLEDLLKLVEIANRITILYDWPEQPHVDASKIAVALLKVIVDRENIDY